MNVRRDALLEGLAERRAARRDSYGGFGSVWQSVTTGLAAGEQQTRYTPEPTLDPLLVEGLLAHDWRARREITQPGGDLIRAGFKLEGLPEWVDEAAVASAVEGDRLTGESSTGLLPALGDLWMEGESYGGAVLIAVADDGLPSSEPLDRSRLRSVLAWEVLDRWSVWPYRSKPGGRVEYWILGDTTELVTAGQIVHPSRVVVHLGMWMPGRWRRRHDGWGLSRLELLRDQRDTLALGMAHAGRLLSRSSQDVLTLAEYSELVANYGQAFASERLAVVRSQLASDGLLVLDGGIDGDEGRHEAGRRADGFQTMARPLGGADSIIEAQHSNWRKGSAMPEVVADGTASGGLNSGEEAGQWRAWSAWVEAESKRVMVARYNWGLGLLFASKDGPTGGRVPDSWTATPIPIAEPDHKSEAEGREAEARVDRMYFDMGAVTDKELRQHRLVDGKHGPVKVENAEILPEPSDDEIEAERLAQEAERAALKQPEPASDVQRQALTGGQITALIDLTSTVLAGDMPADVAVWLFGLVAPGLDAEGAAVVMGLAAKFAETNPPPVPPPSPFGVQQPPPPPSEQAEPDEDEGPSEVALDAAERFARAFPRLRLDRVRLDSMLSACVRIRQRGAPKLA